MAGGLNVQIEQVFLEEATFRHRPGHLDLPSTTRRPGGEIEIEVSVGVTDDGERAVYRVTIDTGKDATALYDARLVMVGLFVREPKAALDLWAFAATNGLTVLFPLLREAMANLTGRGRFGPVWLAPVDVRAFGAKLMQQRAATGLDAPRPTEEK